MHTFANRVTRVEGESATLKRYLHALPPAAWEHPRALINYSGNKMKICNKINKLHTFLAGVVFPAERLSMCNLQILLVIRSRYQSN